MTEVSPTRPPRDLLQREEDLRRVLDAAPVGKQGEGWPGASW